MDGEPVAKRTRRSFVQASGKRQCDHEIAQISADAELEASNERQPEPNEIERQVSDTLQLEPERIVTEAELVQAFNEFQPEPNVPEKGPAVFWEYDRTFNNGAELDDFIRNEKCWSVLKSERLVKGVKTIYRCNRVKRRGNQCTSGVYTLHSYDPTDETIKLFRRRAEHGCEASANRVNTKIGDEVKNFILEQYNLGNPPATIIFKLREKTDIIQPSKEQVTYVINYYKEKLPKADVSISQMTEFFKRNSSLPEDDDDPFVVNFACSPPRTADAQKFFRIFYSTKRLLKHALESDIIHADGTYKILVQGFPILVVGVSDKAKRFHLCGIAITSSEGSDDYEFLFDSLQHGVASATNEQLKPKKLVADAAIPITNGFTRSFDGIEFDRIFCFLHVMSNVEKRKFNIAENKERIKSDLRSLQLVSNEAWFEIGWKLCTRKWKEVEPELIEYFENTYIKNNSNWFEGCSMDTPKTNNCVETFNRMLKDQQTMHLRKPLHQFLPQALQIVRERSKEYVQDKAPPTKLATIDNTLKLSAWNYSQSAKSTVFEKSQSGELLFYVFAGDKMDKISLADDFIAKVFSIHKMTFTELDDWQSAKCTCVAYAKNNICKHVLMIAHRLGGLEAPDDLLAEVETPVPKKNPRGRPRKATKALIRD